ncbi:hypothetical protein C1646_814254 [Rhizophagus diaphanus]|nr:hypothetical protein C1646_814254 [Rhizophagus diaphanus] [Rhizophagus sp. MUCL 43196]
MVVIIIMIMVIGDNNNDNDNYVGDNNDDGDDGDDNDNDGGDGDNNNDEEEEEELYPLLSDVVAEKAAKLKKFILVSYATLIDPRFFTSSVKLQSLDLNNDFGRSNFGQKEGTSLFIRNLDPGVGGKMLYDTFSVFGVIVQTLEIA